MQGLCECRDLASLVAWAERHKDGVAAGLEGSPAEQLFLARVAASAGDKLEVLAWCRWLMCCRLFELPVDVKRADALLSSATLSKDAQATALLAEVDARHDAAAERRNALSCRAMCTAQNRILSVARFGRASYFLTLLASSAQAVTDTTRLEAAIAALPLERCRDGRVANALTDLRIMAGEQTSLARLRGGLFALRGAVCTAMGASLSGGEFWDARPVLQAVDAIEALLPELPTRSPNFSVMVQRASITGARALNLLRLGRDPFEGGERHILVARSESLDNCWASSDDVWFEYADVWIEALPLFIHEERDKTRGVDTIVIEQDAMELALRSLSQRWRANIANVMLSECVDLARLLTGGKGDVLAVAVRLECFWRDHTASVAECKTAMGSHFDALARAVASRPFPLDDDIDAQLAKWDATRPPSWTFSAVRRLAQLRPQAEHLLAQKRRTYPTWIILTTQASGMSDAFAGHWVDEELALANVCEAFQDENGQSLESLARALMQQERTRIEAITRTLIAEFELEYLLEEQSVLAVLRSYSDLAKEVASQYVLGEVGALEGLELLVLANHERLRSAAEQMVRAENEEIPRGQALDLAIYGRELHKRMRSLVRAEVVASLPALCQWQISGHWPHVLRLRLDLGATTARQEVLAQHRLGSDGVVRKSPHGQPLFLQMNNPAFAWTATGSCKQYNRGYGPSRVDLGTKERYTTEQLAQWVGPADAQARVAMTQFYRLYNWDVRAFDEVAQGETMKPLENSLMEMSLGITHLFIPLFQAVNSGNLLKLFRETNQRSEVFARAGGGGSSGFCQPKDIYFLPFVTLSLSDKILEHAGVPMENWDLVARVRRSLLSQVASSAVLSDRDALEKLEELIVGSDCAVRFAPPPLNSMRAFTRIGFGDVMSNPSRAIDTLIAGYHAEVITAVEGRMRFAPVNLIHLMKSALASRGVPFDKAVLVLPVEYKPVSDARLSSGLRLLELLSGHGEHLCVPMGDVGRLLTKFVLFGFDPADAELATELSARLGESAQDLARLFPLSRSGPADVRMVSPFNLASEALFSYVSGSTLRQTALQLMRALQSQGLSPEVVSANCLTFGADVSRWSGLARSQRESLKTAAMHALVFSMRLMDAEYRATRGSHLLQAAEGSDVFAMLVHYDGLTGSEDEGDAVPHAVHARHIAHHEERIIDDLARLRDVMQKNRLASALVLLDAPVQGRKVCLDGLAIKQWTALGGWYVSPTIAPRQVTRLQRQARQEKELVWALCENLNDRAAFESLQSLARMHGYDFATDEERFALDASSWWRGGGFNNHSDRHRWQTVAWARCCEARGVGDLDLGVLVACGLAYSLNGAPQYYISEVLQRVRDGLEKHSRVLRPVFGDDEIKAICFAFIKPRFESYGSHETLVKGESSSLKRAEKDAEVASGRALLNYNLKRAAAATAGRLRGWEAAKGGSASAYDVLEESRSISDEAFGKFLRATHDCVTELVGKADEAMLSRAEAVFGGGKGLDEESWNTFMGRGDDISDIGRLALRARGDKRVLAQIANAAGMLNTCYCLHLTLSFHQLGALDMARIGVHTVERETMEALAKFFSKTVYDHTFDYWPSFMQPTKSGHGFSDYDNIMGRWLGEGRPLTRDECLTLAYDSHAWLDAYVDGLMRSKTWLRTLAVDAADLLLGSATEDAIGGTCAATFSPIEQRWWRFTQKRELAFLAQQGHAISGVVENYRPDLTKPTILICAPIGRPHLTVFLKEAPTYGKCNVVLSRAYIFTGDTMRVPHGLMYVGAEEFAALCPDMKPPANRHDKGVLVAVKFATPLVNHFSMPFHGAPYYQQGLDEQIGLPTSQAWIHCLSPGYSKGEEHEIYRGTDLYPAEERWLSRYHHATDEAETFRRIWEGHEQWPGLRNLTFWRVISKPFRQSGGRGALPCVLRNVDGSLDEEAARKFAVALKEQGERDDQVVQQLVSSTPYAWGSAAMLDAVRSNLVQKGIAVPAPDTPLFVYSRIISLWEPERMKEVVELVVASRMAVSNVGLGGVLFKWHERYSPHAAELSKERRLTGCESMPLVQRRAEYVWDAIFNGDAKLFAKEPDFEKMRGRLGRKTDLTGWSYCKPRYLMHDLLDVAVVELAGGTRMVGPDILEVKGETLVVIDKREPRWVAREGKIVGWHAVKIEDNIGYGLWQPYDQDEMRQEMQVAKEERRPPNPLNWGGDLREIMHSFSEAARLYKEALGPVADEAGSGAVRAMGSIQQPLPQDEAMAEALRKLGKSVLEGDEISVYRKELLARGFPGFSTGVAELARLGRHYLHLRGHMVSAAYAERLAHLVLDDQFSFSSCLQECIVTTPAVAVDKPLFVFLCDSINGARDEVHALNVPSSGHTVAIVLLQSFKDGKVRDGLLLTGPVYRWATFAEPVEPACVHVLALNGANEVALHQRISSELPLSVVQTNRNVAHHSAASLADSKCATTAKLLHLCRVPRALLLPRDAGTLEAWTGALFLEHPEMTMLVLRLQPDEGTEGRGHRLVRVPRGGSLAVVVEQANEMLQSCSAVCVRVEVGNVLFEGRRVSFRVNVSSAFPGKYQCDGGYVQVASSPDSITSNFGGGKAMPWTTFSLDRATDAAVRIAACDALEGLNLGLSHDMQLRLAGVDIVLELLPTGRCVPWVIDVNPRPAGLRHATPFFSSSLIWDAPNLDLIHLISSDADDWHVPLLAGTQAEVDALTDYLRRPVESDPKLLLKQGRACVVMGELLFRHNQRNLDVSCLSRVPATRARIASVMDDTNTEYFAFQNAFLAAANEHEMEDFELALKSLQRPAVTRVAVSRCVSSSGMRIGLSSGNASDNWTHAKLRGSAVLNCAIDLGSSGAAAAVSATVERLVEEDAVILESDDALPPAGVKRAVFFSGVAECVEFANGEKSSNASWCKLHDISDVADPLRMLKHALAFVGNVSGLALRLRNSGVSRSGFASSSAVAVNLLNALYQACGVEVEVAHLGSLALLFENQLGLKSGRQDVDGPLFPGLKNITYKATAGVIVPEIEPLSVALNLVLVDTGVRRAADNSLRRGLNMRHLAFLSREPNAFLCIRKSLGLHFEIVEAVKASNWPLLGRLFSKYMALREGIDPSATGEKHILRTHLFDRLIREGLIYGGMFTGAMGGGIAMLVPVPERRAELLKRLKTLAAEDHSPFRDMAAIDFRVNTTGIQAVVKE